MKRLGRERASLCRDAIERNPHNIAAYLRAAHAIAHEPIRRYRDPALAIDFALAAYFRVLSAVLYIKELLRFGDPERHSAVNIWLQSNLYRSNLVRFRMKPFERVRLAYRDLDHHALTLLTTVLRELGIEPIVASSLDEVFQLGRKMPPPKTETFALSELKVLDYRYIVLDEYFRRRWNGRSHGVDLDGGHRFVYTELDKWTQQYGYNDPRRLRLQCFASFIGVPAPWP